jgi:phospho-N-acetylmuramoyl-pentapeptide-transferase
MIHLYLGLLLFSFLATSILVVPYINLLYRLKFQRQKQSTLDFQNKKTPIFDKFHALKSGTPVGGGLLIIVTVVILFAFLFPLLKMSRLFISSNYHLINELVVIFFTFISFGLLGLYDDILKFFNFKKTGFFGLRMKYKLLLQLLLATIISGLIYFQLGINFIYLPFMGAINLGLFFIPIATVIIVAFANFFNITDGLDGLACGTLMISLFAFWILAGTSLDTPISLFLSLWIGSLIAFLYFNVYPARIWLGDVGSLSFGATFAVIALLLGKVVPLFIVGAPFIVEGMTSAIQIFSKIYLHKKIFPAAPIHLTLQKNGWEEPKIVFRAWLAAIILAIFGLWLGLN